MTTSEHMNLSPGIRENFLRILGHAYLVTCIGRAADLLFFLALFTWFSTEEVSIYSLAFAAAALFNSLLDLGLGQTLVRGFGQGTVRLPQAVRAILLPRTPVILIGVVLLISWKIWDAPPADTFWTVALAGAIQLFLVVEWFCQAWLKAHHRQPLANTFASIDSVGRLLILLVLHHVSQPLVLTQLLFSIIIMHIGLALLSCGTIANLHGRTHESTQSSLSSNAVMRQLFKSGLMFGLIGIITVVQNRVDWILVSAFSTANDVANYALANKIYELLLMGLGVTMLTLYPRLCRQWDRRTETVVNLTVAGLFAAGVVCSLVAALYGPDVLRWLWQDKYVSATPLIRWLMPFAGLATAIMILYYQMAARGMEATMLRISLFATGIQLIVNFLAIPRFGAMGAVAGMATLVLLNVAFYVTVVNRIGLIDRALIQQMAWFILCLWGLAWSLWLIPVPVVIGIAILLGAGTFLGYGLLLTPEDRSCLQALVLSMTSRHSGVGPEVHP
jgi:O-antigen/teichoic acid export membrane protein